MDFSSSAGFELSKTKVSPAGERLESDELLRVLNFQMMAFFWPFSSTVSINLISLTWNQFGPVWVDSKPTRASLSPRTSSRTLVSPVATVTLERSAANIHPQQSQKRAKQAAERMGMAPEYPSATKPKEGEAGCRADGH